MCEHLDQLGLWASPWGIALIILIAMETPSPLQVAPFPKFGSQIVPGVEGKLNTRSQIRFFFSLLLTVAVTVSCSFLDFSTLMDCGL